MKPDISIERESLTDERPDANHPPALHTLLRLDRQTAMPLYQQLEAQIARLVEQGQIATGATLPAERQLAEQLGVSRATVQNGYNALRARQLIRGHGRHGSVVQALHGRLVPGMDRLRGFTQEMKELGRVPSTRVLEHHVVHDRSVASIFGLPSLARFLRLVRVRYGDGIPLSLESAWYSLDAAPALEDADPHGSIYEQLARLGVRLSWCDQTIEATLPAAAESELFGFTESVPCLLIKRRSHNEAGAMVEYVEGLFRGDAYTHKLRLEA